MKATSPRTDTLSLNASINGPAFGIERLEGFSMAASWTQTSGSLAGTFKIQVSNDAFLNNVNENENPNAQWDDISGSAVLASGAGQQMWNVSQAFYKAARIVWTSTSGQGVATVKYHGKGVI